MKTIRFIAGGIIMSALFLSCQQYSHEELSAFQNNTLIDEPTIETSTGKASSSGPCNPDAYDVVLESRTLVDGNWEWVWSVRNPNPGNGNNNTSKDLSHWGMRIGVCISPSVILSAGYSDDGTQWTNFTPEIQSDPSQDCFTSPTLKFDFGTTGTAKSYYRLVVNQEFSPGNAFGYWKAGRDCCTLNFTGINCQSGPIEIIE
jgi:hypothetical protein